MSVLITVLSVLVFVALVFAIGFVLNVAMYMLADKLGWFNKDLKMSWIERKLADYMNK